MTGRDVLFQPSHRRPAVDGQVHHQVDRPAATLAPLSVHELGAVTDSGPRSVSHLDRSCRSRSAPRKAKTVSNGISRTVAARRRKSSKFFRVGSFSLVQLVPQSHALLHVEHMVGSRQPIKHGRSSPPWSGNEMDTYADDLSDLIETLDLKCAVLIGFSAGGGEVARYIGRHGTQRVTRLCRSVQRRSAHRSWSGTRPSRSMRAAPTASRKRTKISSTPTCRHFLRRAHEGTCRRMRKCEKACKAMIKHMAAK